MTTQTSSSLPFPPPGIRPLIVAELSGNHNGEIERAISLIEAAKKAGADAVKFQTYTPDTMTLDCGRPEYLVQGGLWDGHTLYDLYRWAHTPWEWHARLFEHANRLGLLAFSTPFDESSVDFLESLGNPIYKIASFELLDLELIRKAASTGKPVILSTGMANEQEIAEGLATASQAGAASVSLLHCVSGYPTPVEESNLLGIQALRDKFDCPVGLSDHTPGMMVPIAGTALGAFMIEKHFTLRRSDGGPDADFSLETEEFADMVKACRQVASALGQRSIHRSGCETASMVFRRSLIAATDIESGEILSRRNIRALRPGYGLAPKHLPEILGKRARVRIERGTPLSFDLIS